MCKINLGSIMEGKTYPESGAALYEIIEANIDSDKIVIDLDGVISLPSMFLNMSIGQFIKNHGVDLLKMKISFANISLTQAERIKDYIGKISTN